MMRSLLRCPRCQAEYATLELHNLCKCGSPLLVEYDLEAIKRAVQPADFAGREATLWRYREVLPVKEEHIISLGEGMTPLLPIARLGSSLGLPNLYLKDEGKNPTGTFKARGAAVGISKARELGVTTIAMPTAGNAGGAWALYARRAGMEAVIAMPDDSPYMAKVECVAAGAKTYLVDGLISDAGKIIAAGVKKYGWFDTSTLKEPYRIEGKKTMGYEIAEQFGWKLPDAILYPTGGGVGIIGIWKAINEMRALGWVEGEMPKLIAVQAEGCNPVVQAYEAGAEVSEFCQGAQTLARGICVPKALGDFLVLRAVRESGGTAIQVSDSAILDGVARLARDEGIFICPEGGALIAAVEELRATGFLKESERVVLLNTGTGLKYPGIVDVNLPVLEIGAEI